MNKIEFKKRTLERARECQQMVIDDFKAKLSEIRQSDMVVNQGQYDHNQQSLDEANKEIVNGISDQLDFALDEMQVLNKMTVPERELDYVTIGAVVETDKCIFYPSVSVERFEVDGREVIGISRYAPLYNAMEGKREGDTFKYHNITYKIADVY